MNYLAFTLLPHHWAGEGGSYGWALENDTQDELTSLILPVVLSSLGLATHAVGAHSPKQVGRLNKFLKSR